MLLSFCLTHCAFVLTGHLNNIIKIQRARNVHFQQIKCRIKYNLKEYNHCWMTIVITFEPFILLSLSVDAPKISIRYNSITTFKKVSHGRISNSNNKCEGRASIDFVSVWTETSTRYDIWATMSTLLRYGVMNSWWINCKYVRCLHFWWRL